LCLTLASLSHAHLYSFPTRRSSDLTAVSGSWWSGPFDHRGIATADSRDGSPNGFHVLSIEGNRYTTQFHPAGEPGSRQMRIVLEDRKSTRLNSSHQIISYAVFCLKK